MDCLPEVLVSEGIRPSIVNRKFLESNSTSHQWVFGAIAELVDNACDPDVKATQFWIDTRVIDDQMCLTFTDNGSGLNLKNLHRMLSFGFSDKQEMNGHKPIGRYGNGFKSGSMRIGKDALVFTRQRRTMSVGFLSQTYLEMLGSESVVVPMVSWDLPTRTITDPNSSTKKSLSEILQYSVFNSEEELLREFDDLPVRDGYCHGTKIIIFNLKKHDDGELELDFKTDEYDVRLIPMENSRRYEKTRQSQTNVSGYRISLRKYLSILYLKPPMQIFLRNKKVQCVFMIKVLTDMETYSYHSKILNSTDSVVIYFGCYSHHGASGMMIYNRNRLIEAFRTYTYNVQKIRKLTKTSICYQKFTELLTKIVGVVEIDGLTPNHIKQAFLDDNKFRTVDLYLKNKFFEYCDHLMATNKLKASNKPKDLWVQCDNSDCQKWRRLPVGTSADQLPESWFCYMNPDKNYNSCNVEEEPEKDPIDMSRRGRKRSLIDLPANVVEDEEEEYTSLASDEEAATNITPSKQRRADEISTNNRLMDISNPDSSQSQKGNEPSRRREAVAIRRENSEMNPPAVVGIPNLIPSSPRMQSVLSSLSNCVTPQKVQRRRNLPVTAVSKTRDYNRGAVSSRRHQIEQQQSMDRENPTPETDIVVCEVPPPPPVEVITLDEDDDDNYSVEVTQRSSLIPQQSMILMKPKLEEQFKSSVIEKSISVQTDFEAPYISNLDLETVQVLLKENEELKIKYRSVQQDLFEKLNRIVALENHNKILEERLEKEANKSKLQLYERLQTFKNLIVQVIKKKCPTYNYNNNLDQLEIDAQYLLQQD